ncbi:MAG: hypothetical protein M0Z85_01265 [Gammaproteobacteria bacterium]|nr:hypothetical protein [Gammaproteobacteria bacterium]
MTKMEAGSRVSAQWQVHHAGTSWAVALAHSVWIPLGVAFFGAAAGGLISAWAIFKSADKEWRRRQQQTTEALERERTQARRVLMAEMYANAIRLRGAAQALQQETRTGEAPDFLRGRKYDEAYRAHLAVAIVDVQWDAVENIIQAYNYTEAVSDGPLSIAEWKANPERFAAGRTTVVGFAHAYAVAARIFCDAIHRLEKYAPMDTSFWNAVQAVETDTQGVFDATGHIQSPLS